MSSDVLVAGAGPVGLAMAAELARYGVSVRIVDKAAQRTDKSKALVIWSRTLELMDRLGCGNALLDAGYKVSAVNITAGSKQIAHLTLGGVETPHPYALMLPQSETERLLDEHLIRSGVSVERGVELMQFKDTGDKVVATVRHADGRTETIETSWLVGCDGAHSTVRRGLGMQFLGNTLISNWVLADVHLRGVPHVDEVSIAWHSEGVLVIFPITQDRYRVIADVGDDSGGGALHPDPTLAEVQALLDRRGPGGIEATAPVWLTAFRINERKVSDYRAGRVFLAGDAAHIHSPAGGQGMNTGIQDACNLAWKLALVIAGISTPEPLLDSYSLERSAVGEQVLKGAGRATTLAILKGGLKQSIRNHIASLVFGLAPVREAIANLVTEVSIGYPHGPLSVQGAHVSGGPAAGQRAPIRADEPLVGAGDLPRFSLFAEADDASSRLIARYPRLLDATIRKPFSPGGQWLIRPDGYTSLVTRHGEWQEFDLFLQQLSGVTTAPSRK